MKDFLVAMALLIALTTYFSYFNHRPIEDSNKEPPKSGYGTQYKGNSGLVIPGDGDVMAEVMVEPEMIPKRSEEKVESDDTADVKDGKVECRDEMTESTESSEVSESKLIKAINTIFKTKEKFKMDGMCVAFWHGVAAVLIGQVSTLGVTWAMKKIGGKKEREELNAA